MKTTGIFLGGIVSGWLLLWQIQDVANTIETDCVKRQIVTGYNCRQEIAFSEFVYNVK